MTTNLDLPLLPSADQIRRREFATIRRGYDPDQVRDFLTQIAAQIEAIEIELREARMQLGVTAAATAAAKPVEAPVPTEDPYDRLAQRFKDMIAAADRESEGIIAQAKTDAEDMLAAARTEADGVRLDAQSRAEELRQQADEYLTSAREESDRVLAGLAERRRHLAHQIEQMHEQLLAAAASLELGLAEGSTVTAPGDRTAGDVVERYEQMLETEVELGAGMSHLDLDFDGDAEGVEGGGPEARETSEELPPEG
jgi:cell division initiation protein